MNDVRSIKCKSFEKAAKGCATVAFTLEELGLPSEYFGNQIRVNAVFIEDETSKQATSQQKYIEIN